MTESKLRVFPFVVFIVALFSAPGVAFANNDRVNIFVSHITLHTDGSADVQEEIVYNFGTTSEHGIYREIPLVFTSGAFNETRADISSITVTDGHGTPRQATYDRGGNMVTLKIGDADTLVSGSQLYVIRYRLWGAITPSLLEDKFAWDVTGHEWKVPIDRVRVDVILPTPLAADAFSFNCFAGINNSDIPCPTPAAKTYATSGMLTMLRFEESNFGRQQGIFLEFQFRKGIIFYTQTANIIGTSSMAMKSGIVKWWDRPFIDLSLSFPFFVFAGLYSIYLTQKGTSKKEKKHKIQKAHKKETLQLSMRQTYLLSGIIVSTFSLFMPAWNLGIFCSGLVIMSFAWVYSNR